MSDASTFLEGLPNVSAGWWEKAEAAAEAERAQVRIWERWHQAEFPTYEGYRKAILEAERRRYLRYGPTALRNDTYQE